MMELGERLREKRQEMGITQRQLADIIGCSVQTLGQVERGAYVSSRISDMVEDFLDTDIDVPVPGRVYEPIPEPVAESPAEPEPEPKPMIEEIKPIFYAYEVITNARERIFVMAESVKFAGDKSWIVFSTDDRLVATFKTSEILGVKEAQQC
jgi:transcriptional regulator with XRE-family HTH domain